MLLLVVLLICFFRPAELTWPVSVLLIILTLLMLVSPGKIGRSIIEKIIYRTLLASFTVNLFLNLAFYPSLMHYQAASEAAMWINKNNTKHLAVAELGDDYVSAFEFYSNSAVQPVTAGGEGGPSAKPFLLYAPADVVKGLAAKGRKIKALATFKRYWVSRLRPSFLNEKTRAKELTTTMVVLVN
jgi:hypothetical protein